MLPTSAGVISCECAARRMSEDADSILQEVVEEAGVELPTLSSSEVQLESSLE